MESKVLPVSIFEGGKVVNDKIGDDYVMLVGNAKSRMVRAYRSNGEAFA